jgi:tetratricopeptide (TPR) repeat protein
MTAVHAGLMVVNDRSVKGLIKAAMKIRQSFQSYRECRNILKYRQKWEDESLKPHFESGVLLGLGLFDTAISYFPSQLVYLLEIAGFSGNRINGLELLMNCAKVQEGIRYPAVAVALSGYFGFGEFFYGLGEPNTECIYEILNYWLPKAPSSIAVLMGQAFKASWEGDFDAAVSYYEDYSKSQKIVKAFHYFAYWQKMWIHSIQWDWRRAADNADLLVQKCKWSPSMFHYIYASMLSMTAEESLDSEKERRGIMDRVVSHFKLAVKLKRSFGGRRAFHEKLVAEKAKTFINNPDKIVMAPLDLMYLWNAFAIGARNPDCMVTILSKIEDKLQVWTKDKSLDVYAYLTFMKGVVLKHSTLPLTAVTCFFELLDYEKQLKEENHIIPQSCFEIAQIYRSMNDFSEAKKWFKKAKSYNDYKTDSLIKFRIDAAVKLMKEQ